MFLSFPERKKHEYWNHWVNYVFVTAPNRLAGVTGKKLQRIRPFIWDDDEFWADILERHRGVDMTPEEMRLRSLSQYEHMIGNFSGMVYQSLVSARLVK